MVAREKTVYSLYETAQIIDSLDNPQETATVFYKYPYIASLLAKAMKNTENNEAWLDILAAVEEHSKITSRQMNNTLKRNAGDTSEDNEETEYVTDETDNVFDLPMNEHDTSNNNEDISDGDPALVEGNTSQASQTEISNEPSEEQTQRTQEIEALKEYLKNNGVRNMSARKLAKDIGIPVSTLRTDEMCGEIVDSGRMQDLINHIEKINAPEEIAQEPLLTDREERQLAQVEDLEEFNVDVPETSSAVNANQNSQPVNEEFNFFELTAQAQYEYLLSKGIKVMPMKAKKYYEQLYRDKVVNQLQPKPQPEIDPYANLSAPQLFVMAQKEIKKTNANIKLETHRSREHYIAILDKLKSEQDEWAID